MASSAEDQTTAAATRPRNQDVHQERSAVNHSTPASASASSAAATVTTREARSESTTQDVVTDYAAASHDIPARLTD